MFDHIENYADVLAIPCFALLSYYFLRIPQKTFVEILLTIFAVVGLVADTYFTVRFVGRLKNEKSRL